MKEYIFKGKYDYTVRCMSDDVAFTADITTVGEIDTIKVSFTSPSPVKPPVIEMEWELPSVDIQGVWHPVCHTDRGMPPVWSGGFDSSAAFSSPMCCLFSTSGENRVMYSCSDAMNCVIYKFALREEDAKWLCSTKLFDSPVAPMSEYSCTFRINYAHVAYEDAIREVVDLWASMPEYEPMPVADECRHPVYSTWYSFHQYAYGDEIEEVLASAAPLGFKAVIVDDGWQMEDSARTYAYCGDWEPSPAKIADMKAHVARVHAMGMKYYLWYSVPFVGKYSRAYETFKGKYFGDGDTVVLDPRYPEIREYLIGTYERAVKEWDIDGFKLDFVDKFRQPKTEDPNAAPGRDYVSVPQAVDRLMTDVQNRLRALKPGMAIEFRQCYVGPLMRKYGNMFRAADCANDTVTNKIRTVDTRLCVGTTPVHSDMITWNVEDTAQSAALQLVGVMFAVPQISVRPSILPEAHRVMLKRWIDFWEENSDTLLGGRFRAHSPELMYTVVSAESDEKYIAGVYTANAMVPAPEGNPKEIIVADGFGDGKIGVTLPAHSYDYTVTDCFGKKTAEGIVVNNGGDGETAVIRVTAGGIIRFTRKD